MGSSWITRRWTWTKGWRRKIPGVNMTIVGYNAGIVKIYHATNT
jgi:hypothetical protein